MEKKYISANKYKRVSSNTGRKRNVNISKRLKDDENVVEIKRPLKKEEIENTEDILTAVQKVPELIQSMSDEVVCIGIHADVAYLVSTKGLNVFSDIKYMNIFTNLLLENN